MIESVILKHLSTDATLCELLATCGNLPAIFHQIAPSDREPVWAGKKQFPRIIFDVEKSDDAERNISAKLYVDIICSGSGSPNQIETVLKKRMDGMFFSDGNQTFAAEWSSSDSFISETNNQIFGITVTFSLMAFPLQTTGELLDPIAILNTWTKEKYPDASIIGLDNLPDAFQPSAENPAIYWALQGTVESPMNSTWYVTWVGRVLRLHVMCPDNQIRSAILSNIMNMLKAEQRIIFSDGSPLLIHSVNVTFGENAIRAGQLTIQASYGILRQTAGGNPMIHTDISDILKSR